MEASYTGSVGQLGMLFTLTKIVSVKIPEQGAGTSASTNIYELPPINSSVRVATVSLLNPKLWGTVSIEICLTTITI